MAAGSSSPAQSPRGCSSSPSSAPAGAQQGLSLFISLCAHPGLQTLGRATLRLRDTNFPHSSSGVGARAAASPHKSLQNWVIRDRGHGDPHVTASQSPACPAHRFCSPAGIPNSPCFWSLYVDMSGWWWKMFDSQVGRMLQWYYLEIFTWHSDLIWKGWIRPGPPNTKLLPCPPCSDPDTPVVMQHTPGSHSPQWT